MVHVARTSTLPSPWSTRSKRARASSRARESRSSTSQPIAGAANFEQRLAATFRHALSAAARLEADFAFEGRAKFKTDAIEFRIADRLHAPNTKETFEAVKLGLEAFALKLLGGSSFHLQHHADPQRMFEVTIQTDGTRSVGDLLARL